MLSDQHQRAVEIMHECKMDYLEIYEDFYRQGIQVEISDIKAQTDRLDGSRRRIDKLILEYHGQVLTLREWSEITGIQWNTLRMRMRRGWSATDILRTPAKRGNNATVRQQ